MLRSRHHSPQSHPHNQATRGRLLDRGWRYDLDAWFFDTFLLHGAIHRLRHRVLDLAELTVGHNLLDVGCGTGTLAIEASRRVAGGGRVAGVDPAPRQIARARSKARRAGVKAELQAGVIENLSFPDRTFDTVTSTLMMHHLPDDLRLQGLAEIARVLKAQGRLILADFDSPEDGQASAQPAQNGHGVTDTLSDLLRQSGFNDIDIEHIKFKRSHRGWTGASLISALNGR